MTKDPSLRSGLTLKAVAKLVLTRSEEHTSELQSQSNLVCRLLLEKKKIEPHPDWGQFPHLLIWHGHTVSYARRPPCAEPVSNPLCPSSRHWPPSPRPQTTQRDLLI